LKKERRDSEGGEHIHCWGGEEISMDTHPLRNGPRNRDLFEPGTKRERNGDVALCDYVSICIVPDGYAA